MAKKSFLLRFENDNGEKLYEYCDERMISKNKFVNKLIKNFFDKYPNKKQKTGVEK